MKRQRHTKTIFNDKQVTMQSGLRRDRGGAAVEKYKIWKVEKKYVKYACTKLYSYYTYIHMHVCMYVI